MLRVNSFANARTLVILCCVVLVAGLGVGIYKYQKGEIFQNYENGSYLQYFKIYRQCSMYYIDANQNPRNPDIYSAWKQHLIIAC